MSEFIKRLFRGKFIPAGERIDERGFNGYGIHLKATCFDTMKVGSNHNGLDGKGFDREGYDAQGFNKHGQSILETIC